MPHRGHNHPPSMIDTAVEVTASINGWLADHPVIADGDAAHDAKVMLDRGKLCLKDLDDERDKLVRPLNETVKAINDKYRPTSSFLKRMTDEVLRRATDYLAKEEAKRIKLAEEARKKAEAAEQAAREAERRERDAIADAEVGAIVDVAATISEADEAYAEFQRQQRAANLADRETKVKVGGGFTRALSLKNKETLTIKSVVLAMTAIGMTPDIEAAILKGARAYRTMTGELPAGIESKTERAA